MRDSEEVVRFLTAYHEIMRLCDGDAKCLVDKYNLGDERVRAVLKETHGAWLSLFFAGWRTEDFFVSPVSPEFIKAWREYEANFKRVIPDIMPGNKLTLPEERVLSATKEWDWADSCAEDTCIRIDEFLGCGKTVLPDEHWEGETDLADLFRNRVEKRQLLRRAYLMPEIFIPSHLAATSEPSERHDIRYGNVTGLMNYLRETQKAFYLGADFAALVMMRSLLEVLLRYYPRYLSLVEKSEKPNEITLEQSIDACAAELPKDVPVAALHRLRKRANDLVHKGQQRQTKKLLANPKKFEVEMRGFFMNFRSLIENLPT